MGASQGVRPHPAYIQIVHLLRRFSNMCGRGCSNRLKGPARLEQLLSNLHCIVNPCIRTLSIVLSPDPAVQFCAVIHFAAFLPLACASSFCQVQWNLTFLGSMDDYYTEGKRKAAADFLRIVKDAFRDDAARYELWKNAVTDIKLHYNKAGNLTLIIPIAVRRVRDIFKDHPQHPDLISGFNVWIPGYEIALPLEEVENEPKPFGDSEGESETRPPDWYHEAIKFVDKILNLPDSEQYLYKKFREDVCTFQNWPVTSVSVTELQRQVAALFANREDLLQEFTVWYLPCLLGRGLPRDTVTTSATSKRSFFQ